MPALEKRPQPDPITDFYLDAYGTMTGSGMPITLSDMNAYIEMFGLPVDKAEFVYVIREMNKAYRDKLNA